MHINIQFLGLLADLAGCASATIALPAQQEATVATLLERLYAEHGALAGAPPFQVAVNRKLSSPTTPLSPSDEVALLPPFAGG